jgi:CheY-like chemotaxis protein
LTISKALVEMHGGRIEAQSEGKGKGARFSVRLPLIELPVAKSPAGAGESIGASTPADAPSPPAGDAGGQADSAEPGAGAETPSTGPARTGTGLGPSAGGAGTGAAPRRLKILLVEDHGDTARIMKRLLAAPGHLVRTAGDVATALQVAGSDCFDLLISDLGLPDGSGLDVMRQLRQRGCEMPGIALSGYGRDEDVQHSLDAGFATHLTKPVDVRRLQEMARRLAGSERQNA